MPRKVLVVDDDPQILDFVTMGLRLAGYEVLSAGDGQEGLYVARSARPDLMVLDLAMPRMHGYEVCRALRADHSFDGMKIVVTSGKNYAVDIKTAKSLGADLYIVKPYQMQQLTRVIGELLAPAAG